jgi:hypothetical protein
MGDEYLITFSYDSPTDLDTILRQAPFFSCYDSTFGSYEYRSKPSSDTRKMPDITIQIESGGLYFCDHHGEKKVSQDVITYIKNYITQINQTFYMSQYE